MKKILYLMHTPWDWIKQRPHFLAEALTADYDVLACYPRFTRRRHMAPNASPVRRVGITRLPFSRYAPIRLINEAITRQYYARLAARFAPDLVWVTFPGIYPLLGREVIGRRPIVYDCMDDALEFADIGPRRGEMAHTEQRLLEEAAVVFASSRHLMMKLIDRGCDPTKLHLVRNAFGGEVLPFPEGGDRPGETSGAYRICYFGTISEWIDFEAMLYTLDELPAVEFHFYGPVDGSVPEHPRLCFHGPVSHDELFARVQGYDCFIMPFKVNELIRSVDPVKLYEYINLGKNIVSVRYDEILRFEPFVHFYGDKFELLAVVQSLAAGNVLKYSRQERAAFLADNSWTQRGRAVREALKAISVQ